MRSLLRFTEMPGEILKGFGNLPSLIKRYPVDGETLKISKASLVLVNPSGFKLETSLFESVIVDSCNGACDCMRCHEGDFWVVFNRRDVPKPVEMYLMQEACGLRGVCFFKSLFQLMLSEWLRSESSRIWRSLQKGFCLSGYVLVLQE